MANRAILLFVLSLSLFAVVLASAQNAPDWSNYGAKTTWDVKATYDERDCDEGINTENLQTSIEYANSSVTVTFDEGSLLGKVEGYNVSLTQRNLSYPEDGGTTDETYSDLALSSDCSSFSLNSTWKWKDGGDSCEGTSEYLGKRTDGNGCPAPPIPAAPPAQKAPALETPAPAPSPAPEPAPEKSSFGWLIYFALAALAVGAIYFVFKKKGSNVPSEALAQAN